MRDEPSVTLPVQRSILYGVYCSQVMAGEVPEEADKALRDLSNDYSLSVSEKVTHQAWIAVNALV